MNIVKLCNSNRDVYVKIINVFMHHQAVTMFHHCDQSVLLYCSRVFAAAAVMLIDQDNQSMTYFCRLLLPPSWRSVTLRHPPNLV